MKENTVNSKAKIKLYTDPNYFGAEVDDEAGVGKPVVNLPLKDLVGFEPDVKMQDPKSAANMTKMVELIKGGKGHELPPILARRYKGGYQVLDGHHRFHAYQAAGAKTIPAKLIPDDEIQVIDNVDQTSPVTETLKKVKGRWALVSRKDPGKVLQYYHGSGHPSKEWVSKVERRVHSFSETLSDDFKQGVAEGGAETSWSNDTDTITLQDILELTKHIKQINLPINDNLKSKLLHWEGNPEEIERVNQVTVSNQFPILIMVDEQGQIAWILDGNHRLHKAIQSQAKTIPAKLIKPSNLNDKAKKIFNIKEQGVAEGNAFLGALNTARKNNLEYFIVDGKKYKVKKNKKIVKEEELTEKWSKKYKRSIDCSHPKGFSQKAHCAGRKKK